ncbi:hypothetical protein [Roseateles depolymerans]|uniref:Uncharacterized protein n=1 Tax=Roseateles depolymerans TaxID=76731 RepID=A0A0U3MGJ0_9BURK|nr:hypothetical protein [Roseateles depolymerans]ALV07513.1 hypothetical protein RD2015_3052 [Roseateles depolymerans]REG22271.1 hypothetical protein DES44_1415 [Roseateles depolymerans]
MRYATSNAQAQAQAHVQEQVTAPTLAERLHDLLRIEQQTLWTTRRLRVALVPLSQRRRTPL